MTTTQGTPVTGVPYLYFMKGRFTMNEIEALEAIYARQSLDKKDSISIEGQVEHCKAFAEHLAARMPGHS